MKIAKNKKFYPPSVPKKSRDYGGRAFYILNFTFYILLIITLLSCTTQPQTGTLSGNVQLQGEEDHSNITIAIFELATLDPDIVAINQEYPHIGVIINQPTEFDHRFGNLVKYTETDANGNFKIKDIPTGRYNVVAIHPACPVYPV